MKKMKINFLCFLTFFLCVTSAFAQYYEEEPEADITWKQKGFEFYIGSNAYFASKKTANYYNGAPENNINLNLIMNNEYRYREILDVMKVAYPSILENIVLRNSFNYNSAYNVAMDLTFGAKYRFHKNWYLDLSYSFRRLTSSNTFIFDFPGIPPSNIEKPYSKNYSRLQNMVAKEDRHYIDFSVGYIMQNNTIAKPFISVGAMFTYVNIKKFLAFIEGKELDLIQMARNPNSIPGVQDMPDYRVWAGPGYGFSLTAGLKIAFSKSVSLDPVFQLSVASFGNSQNLPNFNTDLSSNFFAGVRLVMCDALILRNK
jgi:opacity protein-like surface antigen